MKDIEFIEAKPRASKIVQSVRKTFIIPKHYQFSYPDSSRHVLTFLDKETIKLPFQHGGIKHTNF